MKTKLTFAALAVFFTFSLVAEQQPQAPEPDARVIAKLAEIVQIREQLVDYNQALYKAGRASAEDVAGMELAEIELAEARVDLARERGQREPLIEALQGLVAAHERRTERAKNRKNVARASEIDVKQAEAALLQAQVRLIREQK